MLILAFLSFLAPLSSSADSRQPTADKLRQRRAMLRRLVSLGLFSVAGALTSVRQHPSHKLEPGSTRRSTTCTQQRRQAHYQHEPGRVWEAPGPEVVTKNDPAIKIKPAKFHNLR